MTGTVAYSPGATPRVLTDCNTCTGTGIGQFGDPDTSKCSSCGGRGYFSHYVALDCDCDGCRSFRGEDGDE